MKLLSKVKTTEQKSKFFGYLFKIENIQDIEKVTENIRYMNPKARHICIGAIFDKEEIFKNDSEVGNPGKKILELLKYKGFDSHVIIIARYFGGVKLGPTGVGKAFKECASECLEIAKQ